MDSPGIQRQRARDLEPEACLSRSHAVTPIYYHNYCLFACCSYLITLAITPFQTVLPVPRFTEVFCPWDQGQASHTDLHFLFLFNVCVAGTFELGYVLN